MKYLAALCMCAVSCSAAMVSGTAFVNLDWMSDGGITLNLNGVDVSAGGIGTPLEMGTLLTCLSGCYLGFYSAGFSGQVSGAYANISGVSSNHFLLSLSGDDTFMSGTLTLYTPMTLADPNPANTVIASTGIEAFATASPVQQSRYYRERTFEFSEVAQEATLGGEIDPAPEPGSFMLLIPAFLFLTSAVRR